MKLSNLSPNPIIVDGFKPIDGFPHYLCNSLGEIKTAKTGKLRKLSPHKQGYLSVILYSRNHLKAYLVHRIVASLFVPNPMGRPHVNHKNGIKTDNRAENLEWVNCAENNKHSRDVLGYSVTGDKNPQAIVTALDVERVKSFRSLGLPQRFIANVIGISQGRVWQICRGIHWRVR